MKYFVVFLVLIGFTGSAFAQVENTGIQIQTKEGSGGITLITRMSSMERHITMMDLSFHIK